MSKATERTADKPAVKALQVWAAKDKDGRPLRRVRIIARHPLKDGYWIYEELGGGAFRTEIGRLGICPEFNLKYVFDLEDWKK